MKNHTTTIMEAMKAFLIGIVIAIPICICATVHWTNYKLEKIASRKQPTRYIYHIERQEVTVPVPYYVKTDNRTLGGRQSG